MNFPTTWQSEWLRVRARALKDERLDGWADYYEKAAERKSRGATNAQEPDRHRDADSL